MTASGASYATGAGTFHYLYDQEGNRIARFVDVNANSVLDAGDTDVTEYEWDYRNRLVKVTDRASYGAAADKIVEYTYDYLNRRFEKTLDTDGDGTVEEYLYNIQRGDELALELSDAGDFGGQYTNVVIRVGCSDGMRETTAPEQLCMVSPEILMSPEIPRKSGNPRKSG